MDHSTWFSLKLSLAVAAAATSITVVLGVVVSYLLAMKHFRGKELADMAITLPLVLPPTVVGYHLMAIFGRRGLIGGPIYDFSGLSIMFTPYAAVLASFTVSFPFMVKTARAAIESVDSNLIDAARSLGHSELSTAFRIVLPLAGRGILAGGVLSFARAMGEFGATLMLAGNIPGRTDTMPLAIYASSASGDYAKAELMVVVFTGLSALFIYLAGKLGKRFV